MEIGSEFWEYEGKLECDNSAFWNVGTDARFTMSGRSAIYFVLQNILQKKRVSKAYLPSYCCDSMIEPFIKLGIKVEFYNVYYDEKLKYDIDLNNDCEIFFAMNYFGYSESNMEEYIKEFSKRRKIIIEDVTHSILSKKRYCEDSDYLIGSLRKWFQIASGAIAVNMKKIFEINFAENTNYKMIDLKKKAMTNKKAYIAEYSGSKKIFLEQYSNANELLAKEYDDYKIDDESLKIIMGIELEEVKQVRRKNVQIIYEKLKNNSEIKFLFPNYDIQDVLLFVPIILEEKDNLRKYLIEHEIYVPSHWPSSVKNEIVDKELSLICDQRYSVEQIEAYIDILLKYFKEKKC